MNLFRGIVGIKIQISIARLEKKLTTQKQSPGGILLLKKDVLKISLKFSFFLNKCPGLRLAILLKQRLRIL